MKFDQLVPSNYTRVSFHVRVLTRYADHNKDDWNWGVVSKVDDVSSDGSFDMHLRMCGQVDPSNNGLCLRFPEDFYEILVDAESYQHNVIVIEQLNKGYHVRFHDVASNSWYMGWITTKERTVFKVRLTCEYNRNQEMQFIFENLTSVCHLPMNIKFTP